MAVGRRDPAAAAEGEMPIRPLIHPYYGFGSRNADNALNEVPPPRRQDGVVLIGLLGGSMAHNVTDAFRSALESWFREHASTLRPVVRGLALPGMKQPPQAIQITNTLALGGEYDIIVNLDSHNELILAHDNCFNYGVSPFDP